MSFFFHNFTSYNGGDGAHEGVKRMVEVDSGHVQEGVMVLLWICVEDARKIIKNDNIKELQMELRTTYNRGPGMCRTVGRRRKSQSAHCANAGGTWHTHG